MIVFISLNIYCVKKKIIIIDFSEDVSVPLL